MRTLILLLLLLPLAACGSQPSDGSLRPTVARLELEPASLELPRGQEAALAISAWDERGRPISEPSLSWTSSDPAVVGVDESGVVRALSLGEALIVAEAKGVQASAQVKVREPRLQSLRIEPREPRVEEGEEMQLRAVILDETGEEREGLPVEWTSEKPLFVSVDEQGVARGLWRNREATITARHGALEDSVTVEVRAPVIFVEVRPLGSRLLEGESLQLSARPLDANLEALDVGVRWRSEDEAIAAVDQEGRVLAKAPGVVKIFADAEQKSGWVKVEVLPRARSLELRLEPSRIRVGGQAVAEIVARDARGEVVEGLELEWRSEDPEVAGLVAGAVVVARAAGSTSLRAADERHGVEASAELQVLEAASFSLSALPGPVFVAGDTFELRLEAVSESGEALVPAKPIWFSHDESVATIDEQGRVEIVGVGQATLGVHVEGFTLALDRPAAVRFEEMALGQRVSCGLAANETVWCWGVKAHLEEDELELRPGWIPERVGKGIVSIVHGEGSCETFPEAGNLCDLVYGLRGDGSVVAFHLGLPPLELPTQAYSRIGAAGFELCGVTAAGAIPCRERVLHHGPAADFLLRPGGHCVLGTDGSMSCAGEGPFDVDLSGRSFATGGAFPLSLSFRHGCGVDDAGEAFCWGENESGQVGDLPAGPGASLPPTPVATGIRSVAVGERVSFFISEQNEISVRGHGTFDLCLPSFSRHDEVRSIHAGLRGHRCLLLEGGRPYCWGGNDMGQAGHRPQGLGGLLPIVEPVGIPPEDPLLVPVAGGLGLRRDRSPCD